MISTKVLLITFALIISSVQSGYVYTEIDEADENDAVIANFAQKELKDDEEYYSDSFSQSESESISLVETPFAPTIVASSVVDTNLDLTTLNSASVKNAFSLAYTQSFGHPTVVTSFSAVKAKSGGVNSNYVITLPTGSSANDVAAALNSVKTVDTTALTSNINTQLSSVNNAYQISNIAPPAAKAVIPPGASYSSTPTSSHTAAASQTSSFTASHTSAASQTAAQTSAASQTPTETSAASATSAASQTATETTAASASSAASQTATETTAASATSSASHTASATVSATPTGSNASTPSKTTPTSSASSVSYMFSTLFCLLFGTLISSIF
jgi:hypothetical protein